MDSRRSIYGALHENALQSLEPANAASARRILPILFERYLPRSVLDVGCGIGTWLAVALELGIKDIAGIEGAWLDPALARFPKDKLKTLDLEAPFDLGRRFDLAVSLEVAEHLSPEAAPGFVASLARHADAVLFSAAIPFQGGDHHVNEQFPDYWAGLFAEHGYVALDFVRPMVWQSAEVLVWLRQNVVVFAAEKLTARGGPFHGMETGAPLSIVHPEVYLSLAARAEEMLAEFRSKQASQPSK